MILINVCLMEYLIQLNFPFENEIMLMNSHNSSSGTDAAGPGVRHHLFHRNLHITELYTTLRFC